LQGIAEYGYRSGGAGLTSRRFERVELVRRGGVNALHLCHYVMRDSVIRPFPPARAGWAAGNTL
jgi:hypothetical protein